MSSSRLVRFLITLDIVLINLFFRLTTSTEDRINKIDNKGRGASPTKAGQLPSTRATLDQSQEPRARAVSRNQVCLTHFNSRPYETNENGARSIFPESLLSRFVRCYYRFTHIYNWYLLVKNFILLLMRQRAFANFRYLDCLLVGRFIINGRAIEVVPHCACYMSALRLIWHYTMMRRKPEFRVPCIEFLLDQQAHEPVWSRARPRKSRGQVSLERESSGADDPDDADSQCHSALLEYEGPCAGRHGYGEREVRRHKLRPNRTREAWAALARQTTAHHKVFYAIFAFLAALFYGQGLPIVLTQRAFEYNYRYCIQWVATVAHDKRGSNQQLQQSSWSAVGGASSALTEIVNIIYSSFLNAVEGPRGGPVDVNQIAHPEPIGEFFMAYTNFVSITRFHLLRIAHELLDSFMLYWELAFSYNSTSFMSYIMCNDIIYYCNSINRRLEELIRKFRTDSLSARRGGFNMRANHYFDLVYFKGTTNKAAGKFIAAEHMSREGASLGQTQDAHLRYEARDIQAQIADMFALINTYNRYLSLQSFCLLIGWLGYSALVSSWIFLPGNNNPKLEWYIVHVAATIYVFVMLSSMSEVKRCCNRLHRLITVAMALDENYETGTGKITWASLLKFYSPQPLYCFTAISRSIETTYLTGLKVLAWLVSALIVASSFTQVRNIR